MKFHLSLRRHPSFVGHPSPHQKHDQPRVENPKADTEKRQPAKANGRHPPAFLAEPPPYSSVSIPEIQINGVQHTGPSSAAPRTLLHSHTYAASDRHRDIAYLQAPMRRESKENALDMLREYDTVIIMDDSASMLQDGRWVQACEALSELARTAASYDKDGIDIHFLNHPKYGLNIKDPKSVRQLFRHVRPQGLTPIANKLDILVGDYVEKLERATRRKKKGDPSALKQIKPVNFIVITDGAPTDEPVDTIVSIARRLDHGHYPLAQLGIQFVQIGDDEGATIFLRELDDDLSGTYGIRDIVDTTPFLGLKLTAEMLIKILLGGINRRVDRRGGKAVMNM